MAGSSTWAAVEAGGLAGWDGPIEGDGTEDRALPDGDGGASVGVANGPVGDGSVDGCGVDTIAARLGVGGIPHPAATRAAARLSAAIRARGGWRLDRSRDDRMARRLKSEDDSPVGRRPRRRRRPPA